MTTHERMFEKGMKWALSHTELRGYEFVGELNYWREGRGKKKNTRATKAFVEGALAIRRLGE